MTVVGSSGARTSRGDGSRADRGRLSSGNVLVTPGGTRSCVVNVHVTAAASGVPSAALTAVVSRAVYVVEKASELVGTSVACWFVAS